MPVDYTTAADFAPATNQGGNGRPARGKRGLDKEEVRAAAAGRWREVLEAAGFDPATLDGQHHGCPRCAGTDRFRYVDSAAGAVFCNQCGRGIGDGFASVAWLQQISFPEAVEFVADAVGFTVGPARKVVSAAPPAPPATPAPAAPPPASSTAAAPEVDPAADIAWREWDSDFKKYAAQYAEAKPGVTVDAIKAAGGRPAIFTRRRKDGRTERVPVFAFAMTDASLDLSKPTGWVAVVANGAPFWKSGPKVMLTPGSKSGLLGGHAIEELKACRQHDSLARLHLWRCEGLNDLLALSGTIPDSERSRHVVITSGAGCESPKHLEAFIGVGGATVIGDCDRPGQKAAKAWAAALAKNGIDARLWHPPYGIQEGAGRDLRDWLAEGHTFAELQREVVENGDKQAAEKEARPEYTIVTSAQLASGDFELEYIIKDTLVAAQPLVLAGPHKSLKTSIIVDAALSMATGEDFLGRLQVLEPTRVLVMSGESGMATLQETARRVAFAKGWRLEDVEHLLWSPDLPRFDDSQHQDAVRELLANQEVRVLFCDPAYLCMPSEDAGNLMAQGRVLRPMAQLCNELGVTLAVAHHAKRNTLSAQAHAPMELADIAWAGWPEFARQWWLLNRRERYEEGSGEHRLWLSVGGSAGHSALWAVDVSEGVRSDFEPRRWEVTLEHGSDARREERQERQTARQQKKAEDAAKQLAEDSENLVIQLHRLGSPESKNGLKSLLGISGTRINKAVAELLQDGQIRQVPFVKNNRQEEGFEPVHA